MERLLRLKTFYHQLLCAWVLTMLTAVSANAQSIEPATSTQRKWEPLALDISGFQISTNVLAMNGDVMYMIYPDENLQTRVKRHVMTPAGVRVWEQVGGAVTGNVTGNSASIAVTNGIVYVAYPDAGQSNKVTVKKLNTAISNSDWEVVGTAGFTESTSPEGVKILLQGSTPYIYYQDGNISRKTCVLKYDGTAWDYVGGRGLGQDGISYNPTLTFLGSVPYIIYKDGGNNLRATVRAYNSGSNTWDLVGGGTPSPGFAQATSITTLNNTLYVAYTEGATSPVTVKRLNANAWETLGSSAGTATGAHVTLRSAGNSLYVLFSDGDNANNTTVKRYNGTGWEAVGAPGMATGAIDHATLALAGNSAYVASKHSTYPAKLSVYRLSDHALEHFGDVNVNSTSASKSFQFTTYNSPGYVTITAPAGFEISTSSSGFTPGVITGVSDGFAKTIDVRFKPTASGIASGYVTITSPGAPTERIYVSGNGFVPVPSIVATTSAGRAWQTVASNVVSFQNNSGVLAMDGDVLYALYAGNAGSAQVRRHVMQPDGTRTWEEVGDAFAGNLANQNASVAVANGVVYVAYPDQGQGNKITVKKLDTNAGGAWETVGAAGFTDTYAGGVKVMLVNGMPYVHYQVSNKTSVMKYEGSAWSYVGPKDLGMTANTHSPTLTFVGSVPYIIYKDGGNNLKATVRAYNSGSNTWDLVGGGTPSPGFAQATSIAAVGSKVYIAYTTGATSPVTVKRLNGNTWETVGSSAGTATGAHVTLRSSNGELYVLFSEASSKLTLKRLNGTNWDEVYAPGIASGDVVFPEQIASVFYGRSAYVAYTERNSSGFYNLHKLSDLQLDSHGDVIINKTSASQSFSVYATNLTGNLSFTAPEGYLISDSESASFVTGMGLGSTTGTVSATIYVRFKPSSVGSKPAYITISSPGAPTQKVLVTGTGIYPMELASVDVTNITASAATLSTEISADRGSVVTEKGFLYNTTGNPVITDASSTKVSVVTTDFDYPLTGLQPNKKYYVRAYAVNANGTGYSETVEFTTEKGAAAINFTSLSQFYNGSERNATATTNPVGLTLNLTYAKDGVALTGAPINAGTYTVTATVADNQDYTGTRTETFTIEKSIAALDLGNLFRIYDGTEKQVIPTTTPAGLNTVIVYKKDGMVLTEKPVNAGAYEVIVAIEDENYTATATGVLTIEKAEQTVEFDMSVAYEYGYADEFDPEATATSGGEVTYTITEGTAFAEVTAENKIRIIGLGIFRVQAMQAGNENYEAATAARQFRSSKATRFVNFENQVTTYSPDGYRLQAATATPAGNIIYVVAEQETEAYPGKVTINGDVVTAIRAGKVKLRAIAADDMYGTEAFDEMELTIAKANAAIAISNLEQQYDGAAKHVTVTTTPTELPVTVTYDGSSVLPTAAGTYTVVATVQHENFTGELTATLTIVGTTAIGDSKEQIRVSYYPNPTERFLYLELQEDAVVEVISVTGQVLLREKVKAGETALDLAKLHSGQYILRVQSKQHQVQKKFIKR